MKTYSFEKLNVWNRSRELVKTVYQISQKFPREELFGLTSQLRRSASSVPTNLAEGSGRITGKEKARFSEIAYGSLVEVLNHLILANDLGFLDQNEVQKVRPLIDEIGNKINRLRKAQLTA